MSSDDFEELAVLGSLPAQEAAGILRALGDEESADRLELANAQLVNDSTRSAADFFRWPFSNKPWQYAAHSFGYIAPNDHDAAAIKSAGTIEPDLSLRGASLRITLDR